MHKILMAAFAAAMAIGVAATPAHATGLDHTWVASNGNNAFVCDRPNPCADFATAISKTNANGEIGCVDSGQFGPLTITKAITIDCTGVQASVLVAGPGSGIAVTVPGGTKIVLRGLDIQGNNNGASGIALLQGGSLHIENCVVRNFTATGIFLTPTNETELYVIDTSVINNAGNAISLQPSGGPVVNAVLDRVHLNNNSFGFVAHGASGATTRAQITNSTISGNAITGVVSQTGAQPTTVIVASSLLSANAFGAASSGSAAALILNGNTITNNGTAALLTQSGGAIFSYGNNAVNDNASPGDAPTPVALR